MTQKTRIKADGGYVTAWTNSEDAVPNDGEHIICLFENSSEWSDWHYFAENKTIRRKHGMVGAIPIYECYPFDAIAYWMRIPPVRLK